MKTYLKYSLAGLLVLSLALAFTGVVLADTTLNIPLNNDTAQVGTDCPDTGTYWHFVISPNNGHSYFITFHLNLGDATTYDTSIFVQNGSQLDNVFVEVPSGKTINSLIKDGSSADIGWDGTGSAPTKFQLSHICPGETDYEHLKVSKTVETSYTRTHKWSIDKYVSTEYGYKEDYTPKVWLYIDGHGDETATWTIDVNYDGYDDSDFNVSGYITIENDGTLDAYITKIKDVLAGTALYDVDCGDFYGGNLAVGEKLTCSYGKNGYVTGFNEAIVTTERDTYSDTKPISWGDPTTEYYKTVTVKDISDLFGEVELGTVTAPDNGHFTYTKDFAWADYGADFCGDYVYNNTATIVDTGQTADATLKVNVQCYIYETAYAKGSDNCFIPDFNNWGWSNPVMPGEYTWDLWAGAGQCDTSKGTLVGTATVVYGSDGYVTVTYNVSSPYLLKETHVYAGYDEYPLFKGKPIVAPGKYYNASPFDGSQVYVIAHAVVGIPDPNFGP